MKNLATTKYFGNINNYLFYTTPRSWDIKSKYQNFIESLKLQYWMKLYINKTFYPFLKSEQFYNYFRFGNSQIPHPDKIEKGGEDAFFHSKNLLVVADGVGGWNQQGVDPALYSKKLCELIHFFCNKFEEKFALCEKFPINEFIVKSWIKQAVNLNKEKGSSTVCVLYLDKIARQLYSSYLGDSCYLLVRPVTIGDFKIIFKSEEQSHGFNIPFQVGTEGDNPANAKSFSHKIEINDLIILASDGLWDNIDDVEIIKSLNEFSRTSGSINIDVNAYVKKLCYKAKKLSGNKNHFSPFSKKAMDYNKSGKRYMGGKPDDITIVMAQIVKSNENEEQGEINCSKSLDTTIDEE